MSANVYHDVFHLIMYDVNISYSDILKGIL